jgi:hypothetical protein
MTFLTDTTEYNRATSCIYGVLRSYSHSHRGAAAHFCHAVGIDLPVKRCLFSAATTAYPARGSGGDLNGHESVVASSFDASAQSLRLMPPSWWQSQPLLMILKMSSQLSPPPRPLHPSSLIPHDLYQVIFCPPEVCSGECGKGVALRVGL